MNYHDNIFVSKKIRKDKYNYGISNKFLKIL